MKLDSFSDFKKINFASFFSFLFCMFLLAIRYFLTKKFNQAYLIWNLFLAIIPILITEFGYLLLFKSNFAFFKKSKQLLPFFCLIFYFVWLLFFPNSPYLFTDFIHVVMKAGLGSIAVSWITEYNLMWFDIILNACFSYFAFCFGQISLFFIHKILKNVFSNSLCWILLVFASLSSGLAVYIGRFYRFNSWDILFHPINLIKVISEAIKYPFCILFSLVMAFFIFFTYFVNYKLHNK